MKSKCIKCWTLNYPRPIGVEPTVYLDKPVINFNPDDSFANPDVVEHVTVMGALKYIIDFNWGCNYLKHINIKGDTND